MKPAKLNAASCALSLMACYMLLGPIVCAQTLLPNPSTSRPHDLSYNVPREKGKITGLLFRFICQGGSGCFPLSTTLDPSGVVQLTIGASVSSTILACPAPTATTVVTCHPGDTAPGTCSYKRADSSPTSSGDSIEIIYNGVFPVTSTGQGQPISYSVTGARSQNNSIVQISANPHVFRFCSGTNTPATVSLEQVFDISGSMDWPVIPPSSTVPTPTKRIVALRNAADVFYGILNAYALPQDKLGLVFFTDFAIPGVDPNPPHTCTVLPTTQPSSPPTQTNLLAADDPVNVTATRTCVQNQGPTRSTSIGSGLLLAKKEFELDTANPNSNKQVLLFSDGEQNNPPYVGFRTPAGGSPVLQVNGVDYPTDIHVCTVTAGRQTAPGYSLQNSIADASCGHSYGNVTIPPATSTSDPDAFAQSDLQTFFAQFLETSLPTDKLETVSDTVGTVSKGTKVEEKFLGSADDLKMTIVLAWFGGSEADRSLPFSLKAPDGTLVNTAGLTTAAPNVSFTTLAFPLVQEGTPLTQKGEWQLLIDGSNLHSSSINYHLLVLADNPDIASDFTSDARDVGTGEPIPITVRLRDNGKPLLGATIQVQATGPLNSQGNFLSTTATLAAGSPGADPASTKGQAKLDALASDPANASLFANRNLPTVTLVDSGGQGVYAESFSGTSNEGHYYFDVRVRGSSSAGGEFQRSYRIARFVRSKPDPGKTAFRLLSTDKQRNGTALVKLQVIPHDAFGNFLGPGYEKDMHITSSAGTIATPLDDKLDGSYEITYLLPSASSNPSFTIEIMGEPVTTKTLHDLQGHPFALFLDVGAGIPHGTFSNFFNTGFALDAGFEYIVTNHFSAEGVFGYDHFPASAGSGIDLFKFRANGKFYLTSGGPFRPYFDVGIGAYKFNQGSTYFGGNFGAGVLREFGPHWGLQASYHFHAINSTGVATYLSEFEGGIRYKF